MSIHSCIRRAILADILLLKQIILWHVRPIPKSKLYITCNKFRTTIFSDKNNELSEFLCVRNFYTIVKTINSFLGEAMGYPRPIYDIARTRIRYCSGISKEIVVSFTDEREHK